MQIPKLNLLLIKIIRPNSVCSVFKSRQRDYFCNLMRRVCPRQEVQDVKENILIHKVEKLKGRVVPVSIVVHFFFWHRNRVLQLKFVLCLLIDFLYIKLAERAFLPREMQTHLKVQDLKKKQKDLLQRFDERKKEYEAQAASIKAKSMNFVFLIK